MKTLSPTVILVLAAPFGLAADRVASILTDRPPTTARAFAAAALGVLIAASACLSARLGDAALLAGLLLGWTLLSLTLADLDVLRLPDRLTLPLVAAGLVVSAWPALSRGGAGLTFDPPNLVDHLIGAAVGYTALAGLAFAYRKLRGREGLGLGDAKLAACAGAWLGWAALPLVVLLACAAAFAWIGLRLVRGRASLAEPLPFGPPLALAIWILWLVPSLTQGLAAPTLPD